MIHPLGANYRGTFGTSKIRRTAPLNIFLHYVAHCRGNNKRANVQKTTKILRKISPHRPKISHLKLIKNRKTGEISRNRVESQVKRYNPRGRLPIK
jgi:hypothetical protein